MRKRLLMLSVLLLMVCGQMWAEYSNGKPDWGTRCNGNSPTTIIVDGVMYSLYSNQNYTYTHYTNNEDGYTYSTSTSESGNYAVAVYAQQYDTRSELTIRSTIQEGNTTYTVVAVGEQFFWYNQTATKLTIPATVQTLEGYALEDNKINLSEIVIEDSENSLECYRTTGYWGAFYWNSGLKKVYIGRDLYTMGDKDYFAPFYKLNTNATFDLTIGPNVTTIPEYCFGNCDDIKSIKAMPQTPPTCGTEAFYGVTNSIPVYVSYKTKNAYTSASDWKNFTNYELDIDLCKADALNDLDAEAGENPSLAVQGVVSNYKGLINSASSGDDVVAKLNAGKAAIQLQKAKDSAIAALNTEAGDSPSEAVAGVRDTWIANVNKATTIPDVETQKNNGIAAIQLQKEKETAIDALNEAAKTYPSDAANGIVTTYTAKINAATTIDAVTKEKEAGIKALMDAKDLQDAKEAAISCLNDAKKDYPSDESEDIVSTYTDKINAATTIDAVTAIKNEGIQALAYAAEMPTVLHINFAEGSAPIEKEHHMTASKFTLDKDCNVVLTVNGNSVTYPWDMAGKITLFKGAPAVELKANKDPQGSEYYTTFYSSLEAYTIPEGVKAYAATVDEMHDGVILLSEIKDEVIPAKTAVVLVSTSGTNQFGTCDYVSGDVDNDLLGTDVEIPVPDDNCYVLSGTTALGMGLYPWAKGKILSANKAYLQLTESSPAKAFTFVFDDETTGIQEASPKSSPEGKDLYNLNGIRVNDSYKGIVIKNGKKVYQK